MRWAGAIEVTDSTDAMGVIGLRILTSSNLVMNVAQLIVTMLSDVK